MIKKLFFFLFCLFLLNLKVSAQENLLSLEEAIEIALNQNLLYKQAQLQRTQAELNLKRDKFNLLPSLNASAIQGYNWGRTIDPFSNLFVNRRLSSNQFSLNGNWLLFSGLSRYNQIKSSQFSLLSETENIDAVENDVSLQTANLFLQIVMASEQMKIAQEQYKISEDQLKRNQTLFDVGQITRAQLLESKAQLADDNSQLTAASNQYNQAKASLRQYLNLEPTYSFEPNVPDIDTLAAPEYMDWNPDLETKLRELPDYQAAELAVQSADYNISATKGRHYPTLSLNASVNSGYSSGTQRVQGVNTVFDTIGITGSSGEAVLGPRTEATFEEVSFANQIENNFGQQVTLSLNVPIFQRYQTTHAVQIAKINRDISNIQKEQTIQELRNEMYQAFLNMQNAYNQYLAAYERKQAQEILFEQNQFQYEEGILNYFDWQNSKSSYTNALSSFINSKYEYLFNKMAFEFYLGNPLSIN